MVPAGEVGTAALTIALIGDRTRTGATVIRGRDAGGMGIGGNAGREGPLCTSGIVFN